MTVFPSIVLSVQDYLLPWKDYKRRKDIISGRYAFYNANPVPISRLDRERLLVVPGNDNLDVIRNALHEPLLIHVIPVALRDAVLECGCRKQREPSL